MARLFPRNTINNRCPRRHHVDATYDEVMKLGERALNDRRAHRAEEELVAIAVFCLIDRLVRHVFVCL